MIWNFIRDFIVENITGGYTSDHHTFFAWAGNLYSYKGGALDDISLESTSGLMYPISSNPEGYTYYLSLADWLATTLTAICMCLIVAFAIWLVIWVFKAVAHAFLLRR